ncbi:polymorphic toxin-type HINT domain-containing protein [Streptomyces sp. NPDC012508]|uniref:polymorphic toxin-type HINT domain-containing protein n=1 Tax=Streptomyces sp. NPDC012508 TaxID=3364837 RepID=UPI0036B15A36
MTAGTQETSFVYDAGGNRLIKRDPTGTTLYLPGTELQLDANGNVAKTTRYYAHPAGPVMVKVAVPGVAIKKSYLLADRNGTATTSVDTATKAVTRRKFTPFGEERGTAPSMWPDDKGYLGGTKDVSTGLTHLGAREYDPTLGRFISVDPKMDVAESQTMNPYAYGNNSPITFSDPSGEAFCIDEGCTKTYTPKPSTTPTTGGGDASDGSPAPTTVPPPPTKPTTTLSEDDVKKATNIKQKSKADVVLEIAVEVAKGIIGVDDIQACIGGDGWACASLAFDAAMPFAGRAKRVLKALETAWTMYNRWEDEVRWATNMLRRADDEAAALAKYTEDYAGWKKQADAAKAAAKKADEAAADAAKKADGDGGSPGGSCPIRNSFTPDTKVLLADGSAKAIKDLKPGDKVLATDEKTGETAGKDVAATIVGEGEKHLVRVTIDTDGAKGTETAPITATDGHPFWVLSLRKWVDAKDLKPGQWLRTSAGTHVQVSAVQAWTQTASVRNLTVADFHTYYVLAGTTSVLVHNTDCGPATEAARAKAVEYGEMSGRQRPGGAVEALVIKGHKPIVRTSDGGKGGSGRTLHATVQNILDSVPSAQRSDNHGGCGLPVCLTDALNQGLDPTGASAASFMIRSPSNKNYLQEMGPCDSCAFLVSHFKINFETKW